MLIEAFLLSNGPLKRGESAVIRTADNDLSYTVSRGLLSGRYRLTGNNPKSKQKVKEHLEACD